MRRLHDIGLETQDQHVLRIDRPGFSHPRPGLRKQLRRERGQHIQGMEEGGFLLDHAMDAEIADGEFESHVDISCDLRRRPQRAGPEAGISCPPPASSSRYWTMT